MSPKKILFNSNVLGFTKNVIREYCRYNDGMNFQIKKHIKTPILPDNLFLKNFNVGTFPVGIENRANYSLAITRQ